MREREVILICLDNKFNRCDTILAKSLVDYDSGRHPLKLGTGRRSKCEETGCKVKILPSVSELIDELVIVQKIGDVSIDDLLGWIPRKSPEALRAR